MEQISEKKAVELRSECGLFSQTFVWHIATPPRHPHPTHGRTGGYHHVEIRPRVCPRCLRKSQRL